MRGTMALAGRCLGTGLGAAAAAVAPGAAAAQQVQTGMIVSAGVDAESNPYSSTTDDKAAVAATAELRPRVRITDARTVIDISAGAQFRQFVSRYGLEDSYNVNANAASRVTERLTVRTSGFFSSTESGFNGLNRPALSAYVPTFATGAGGGAIVSPEPVGTPDLLVSTTPNLLVDTPLGTLTDVTVLGQRTRVKAWGSGLGFDARLSDRTNLSTDFNAQAERFSRLGLGDFDSYNGEAQFSRGLTELTSVGVIGGFGLTDYLGGRVGDARNAFGLLSLDRRFSARWSLSASVGASYTSIHQRLGQPDTHFTALNVRGQFCWQDSLQRLCLTANRSPQPSANGNVRVADALGVDFSRRLSERERLTITASYNRTGPGRGVAANLGAITFAGATARYDKQLTDRATLFTSASINQIYGGLASRRPNVGAAAGVQFRLGALR